VTETDIGELWGSYRRLAAAMTIFVATQNDDELAANWARLDDDQRYNLLLSALTWNFENALVVHGGVEEALSYLQSVGESDDDAG
jgi:hypothetical protein